MRDIETLASARTPDGRPLTLTREAGHLVVRVDRVPLMTSRTHGSEEAMAELACAAIEGRAAPRMLVAGLGMGFTLRAALDRLPADAEVVVVELMDAVVDWNRLHLGALAGRPLDDPRVQLRRADVASYLRGAVGRFDAILLDVDNGPEALTVATNVHLYSRSGITRLRRALRSEGVLVVWSTHPAPRFEALCGRLGLDVRSRWVRARGSKGARHTLYVARPAGAG